MARTMMGGGLLLGRPRSDACAHAGHVSRKRIPFTAPTSASCQVTSGGQLFHHERFSRCASKSCRGFIGIPNTIFQYSSRGNLLSASCVEIGPDHAVQMAENRNGDLQIRRVEAALR